ncbi:GIY-YIG nuclease family protein [Maribacter sp.]|uniref:GIY-YIG nuclease family protein n=1 Tax=Maribacter sp. TaxID=1897614 RepID=UPI0025BC4DF1|nr:GIY-YIG nuclease family protein [Maribacter sp.]
MFYVYILRSEVDGCLYKGMTNNLQKRIEEHNSGKNKSTKGFLPWILVYNEEFETRIEARAREKYFKSGVGREYLKSILDN